MVLIAQCKWETVTLSLAPVLLATVYSLVIHQSRSHSGTQGYAYAETFLCAQVMYVVWHPSASDVLLSVGADHAIFIWNTKTQEAVSRVKVHPDLIYSVSWNYDGSLIATSCRDKKLRVVNPRTAEVLTVNISAIQKILRWSTQYTFVGCIMPWVVL